MRRQTFNELIENRQFLELFIMEMGWNNVHGNAQLPSYVIDEKEVNITAIAERNGFQVLECAVDEIPTSSFCKKLDLKLRKQADSYILIFCQLSSLHHLWVAPVKKTEKRDLVFVEYETLSQADFLFSKIDGLTFDVDEHTTIMDVKERIQTAFVVNSEKLTKDFYQGFRRQHAAFVKFISGIDDEIAEKNNRNKQWYASIMLNRLMFCYFIQKKGFLDGNTNYLREKLAWVKANEGSGQFYNFYRSFLVKLFHGGLNAPKHSHEFEDRFGRIPYLNGGMFDEHTLEQQYSDIDIEDEAFENLFAFFDQWHWHLDDRHTASGKDINPDVLGYIFEQYINDRAAMGAYYTKEDITEYIGKNCILPFLMDRVRTTTKDSERYFRPNGYVWQTLAASGDRYIYDAVKKGYTDDWASRIPPYISEGIDTSQPNLLERRSRWNEKTSEEFALPTEIWRETVERLQRCGSLLEKIQAGDIHEINDFITLNLDIRQFVYDLLLNADDHHFVAHFYHALQRVTILDPTCGSGAFLFAAMNILEPLYEVCIERMEQWHEENPNLFRDELDEIDRKYRSNRQYFIYKSIILRNLYGVDIMVEATEIAKLRLFLKMVAVVEVDMRADNLGLDPLPDIDFNIRCGNTLVGYATQEELERDLTWGNMFANLEFKEKVEQEMQKVAMAYQQFKAVQFTQDEDLATFKQAKRYLRERLDNLTDALNQRLFASSGDGKSEHFDHWKATHQPFHWLAEFYEIIKDNGGFDVIIGNPPYVEYNKKVNGVAVSDIYRLSNYCTINCSNLYAFIIERSINILNNKSYISLIVPMALIATKRMADARNYMVSNSLFLSFYNLAGDWHPGKLFEGVRSMFTIFICKKQFGSKVSQIFTSDYTRWLTEERQNLFVSKVMYVDSFGLHDSNTHPRIGHAHEKSILGKMKGQAPLNTYFTEGASRGLFYYRNAGLAYYQICINFKQRFEINGEQGQSSTLKPIHCTSQEIADTIVCVLNSNLFSVLFYLYSDCYHLTQIDIARFKIDIYEPEKYTPLCKNLMRSIKDNSFFKTTYYKTKGEVKYQEFYPRYSKSEIDEIDKVLAKHYGFTDEELDFIINYDIKYRMGDELNEED